MILEALAAVAEEMDREEAEKVTAAALDHIKRCNGPGGALWVAATMCKEQPSNKQYWTAVFDRIKELTCVASGPVNINVAFGILTISPKEVWKDR